MLVVVANEHVNMDIFSTFLVYLFSISFVYSAPTDTELCGFPPKALIDSNPLYSEPCKLPDPKSPLANICKRIEIESDCFFPDENKDSFPINDFIAMLHEEGAAGNNKALEENCRYMIDMYLLKVEDKCADVCGGDAFLVCDLFVAMDKILRQYFEQEIQEDGSGFRRLDIFIHSGKYKFLFPYPVKGSLHVPTQLEPCLNESAGEKTVTVCEMVGAVAVEFVNLGKSFMSPMHFFKNLTAKWDPCDNFSSLAEPLLLEGMESLKDKNECNETCGGHNINICKILFLGLQSLDEEPSKGTTEDALTAGSVTELTNDEKPKKPNDANGETPNSSDTQEKQDDGNVVNKAGEPPKAGSNADENLAENGGKGKGTTENALTAGSVTELTNDEKPKKPNDANGETPNPTDTQEKQDDGNQQNVVNKAGEPPKAGSNADENLAENGGKGKGTTKNALTAGSVTELTNDEKPKKPNDANGETPNSSDTQEKQDNGNQQNVVNKAGEPPKAGSNADENLAENGGKGKGTTKNALTAGSVTEPTNDEKPKKPNDANGETPNSSDTQEKQDDGNQQNVVNKAGEPPKAGSNADEHQAKNEGKATEPSSSTSFSSTPSAIAWSTDENIVIDEIDIDGKGSPDKSAKTYDAKDLRIEENEDHPKTEDKSINKQTKDDSYEDEEVAGGHFMAYFLVFIVVCVAGYILFHNKQKIIALVIEGKGPNAGRRPSSKEYKRLKTEDVMPSLEKSAYSKNYVF